MKRYPTYKDSCVEWLGEVPEGWEVVPVKTVATCNDEVLTEGTDPLTVLEYVEISGVDANGSIVEANETSFGAAPSRARRVVRDGDVLISTVRTYLRAIAQVTEAAPNLVASTGFAVLRPKSVSSSFLGQVCRSEYFVAEVIARSVGVSYPAINASQIMALPIPIPPLSEQQAIAAFLDRETAKIDGLIEEQRRLIALLAEKRQATISHAVTRGLNPDARLKPSGIDWLGDVPEEWDVVPLSAYFKAAKGPRGQMLTKEYCALNQGEFPVYSGQTENNGVMGAINDYDFDAGDRGFLFSTTVGAKAMTVSIIFGRFSLSQNCMMISSPSENIHHPFYLFHFMPLFSYFRGTIPEHMQASFRMSDLYKFRIALPPVSEQRRIANHLQDILSQQDALTEAATSAITLLQERRAALISAAVTGKIDVRDLVPAAPSASAA